MVTKKKIKKRPTTIAEYIQAAPQAGQPHLHQLYALLKRVAPKAQQVIKWGVPFFVEPRFLYSFSAHKNHLDFVLMPPLMERFRTELKKHKTTKMMLQIAYSEPLPATLIRKIALYRLKNMGNKDSFW